MRKSILLILSGCILGAGLFYSISDDHNYEYKLKLTEEQIEKSKELFVITLQKHLDAVSNKNIDSLKSTMSPNGEMQLILSGQEILYSVDSFINFHTEWFKEPNWSFETKILNTKLGQKIGMATTQIIYREPERNGKPYFNRMIVSYVLEKKKDQWYVIKDHATSIEKTK